MKVKKIFLIDDHFVVREGLKLIFETEDEYEVIGEAEDGETAIEKLTQVEPDVILLDLNMPRLDGLDVLQILKDKNYRVPILILTTFEDQKYIKRAFALGAKGYLLKDASRDEIIRSIDAAIRGEILLKTKISNAVFNQNGFAELLASENQFGLTDRELDVLRSVVKGETSKAIAIEMGISERTVKAHLTKIYEKLDVDSRANAVAKAISMNIVSI